MSEPSRSMISLRTAMLLYALLTVVSFALLKGTALAFALIIVGALATKSILHYYRDRME